MSEVDNLGIYSFLLAKEVTRQQGILEDPSLFLEELEGYIVEPNDEVLHNILSDEIHLKRIWGGILLLASQWREKNDPLWPWTCEPVIRRFWDRVAPLVFRENDSLSNLLKERLHESIFGEQEQNKSI